MINKGLRYGHLMVMADQDHDGSHIKGLVINFIHQFWPSLIKMNTFLKEFATPIIKARKGENNVKTFFTQQEYETWKRTQGRSIKKWHIKYYKGLGTSDNEEAKEYFSNLRQHTLSFRYNDEVDDQKIELAFSHSLADSRKEWLNTYDENSFVDHSVSHVSYKDFVDKELIGYSRANCIRAIPSVSDGYKPGQRKIMFACFKRNLIQEIKVAQLAGYVAEKSAYHHGEQSLASTIVGLAQNFVGSNNISVLEPKGQFGSRSMGGKDAASARYIYTRLTQISSKIFHSDDKYLLKYLNEEGQSIEPEYYIPVIPMVLVNGAEGIGTGWSTTIPCFNPFEIIQALKDKMNGKDFQRLVPWYKHFNGEIFYEVNGFKCEGKFYHNKNEGILRITELPIKKWTRDYKKFLEDLMIQNIITDLREYHGSNQVDFEVYYETDSKYFANDEAIIKYFKLSNTMSDKNYVLFDRENKLKRYADETEILDEFFDLRMNLYYKRKNYLIRKLERDLEILVNKERFITEVINEDIVVNKKKKKELLSILDERNYSKYSDIMAKVPEENAMKGDVNLSDNEDEDEKEGADIQEEEVKCLVSDYNYLLSQSIWSLTEERIISLRKERETKEKEIEELKKVETKDIWRKDLDEILETLLKIDKKEKDVMNKAKTKMDKMKKKKPKAKGKGKKRKISEESSMTITTDQAKNGKKIQRKPPPRKERGKVRDDKSMKKGEDIVSLLKKKEKILSTTEESLNQISAESIENLPLIQRMRLKEKMRMLENKEEKKGSFIPEVDTNIAGNMEKLERKANPGNPRKKRIIDSDDSSIEEIDEVPMRSKGGRNATSRKVNYQLDIDSDDDSSFDIA